MSHATLLRPDLDRFCLLDRLGLSAIGQQVFDDHAVLECRVLEPDDWCRRCGCEGVARDSITRRLAHVPLGWRPTILKVRVRRYRCTGCGHVWRQDMSKAAAPRTKLSRHAVLWALKSLVIDRMSIARVAAGLGSAWHTVNDAVLAAGRQLLIDDPARFDGVRVIGVDEHAWRHTRAGDKFVTVIIDLTPVRDGSGPARLLDIVPGRSKQVFTAWLQAQPAAFRDAIEVVSMGGFTGFKTATTEQLPDATAVMDPFHVVALAGDALDRCRQRVQQETCGHRGRTGDPLYGIRRVLRTGADLLTERQRQRLAAVFADETHIQVEATWSVYQRIVAAYRHPDRAAGIAALRAVIASISRSVPTALPELITLGRTLKRRTGDILAYLTGPAKATARPRRSTAVSSTCAAPPSGSATSPTTSPERYSTPAASDPEYTLFCDEPHMDAQRLAAGRVRGRCSGPGYRRAELTRWLERHPPVWDVASLDTA